jgi:hypothetical protein
MRENGRSWPDLAKEAHSSSCKNGPAGSFAVKGARGHERLTRGVPNGRRIKGRARGIRACPKSEKRNRMSAGGGSGEARWGRGR